MADGSLQFARSSLNRVEFTGTSAMTHAGFTVIAVIKPKVGGTGGDQFIVGSNNGHQYSVLLFNGSTNSLEYTRDGGITVDTMASGFVSEGSWQVVGVTKVSGSAKPRFHNGSTHVSGPTNRANPTAETGLVIGGLSADASLGFDGQIAAVALFNSVLTDAQIAGIATYADLVALGPANLIAFKGSSPFTDNAGSLTQSVINGTTHVDGDAPTGFWGTPVVIPGTPAGVMAGWGDASAVAFWQDQSEATVPPTGYRVYANGTQVYEGPGDGTYGTMGTRITGLTNGTAYDLTVTAYNDDGESAPTSAITVTPTAATAQTSGSREFDGASSLAFLPGVEPQGEQARTFWAVIKPDNLASEMGILRAEANPAQGDTDDPFSFFINSSGKLCVHCYNPGATSLSVAGAGITLSTGWQIVAVTIPYNDTPRFHRCDLSTGAWTHADGSPDTTYTIHPHGRWIVGKSASGFFDGKIAFVADSVSANDGDVEAADLASILEHSYAAWGEVNDSFLDDQSPGYGYAALTAVVGAPTHSTDNPPNWWAAMETATGATTMSISVAATAAGLKGARAGAAVSIPVATTAAGKKGAVGTTALGLNIAVTAAGTMEVVYSATGSTTLSIPIALSASGRKAASGNTTLPVAIALDFTADTEIPIGMVGFRILAGGTWRFSAVGVSIDGATKFAVSEEDALIVDELWGRAGIVERLSP